MAGVTTMMMARVVVRLRHYFSCVGGLKIGGGKLLRVLNDDVVVVFVLGTTFFFGQTICGEERGERTSDVDVLVCAK